MAGIGERFHRGTRYRAAEAGVGLARLAGELAPVQGRPVRLPDVSVEGGPPAWSTLAARRSRRAFSAEALTLGEAARLVWAAAGVTGRGTGFGLRCAPSAGALYPLDLYLAARAVSGLDPGIYLYRPEYHALAPVRAGDPSEALAAAALGQGFVGAAAVNLLWAAVPERAKGKYRERAWRYVYLDAGHAAANVLLAAEGLDLGACAVGAFLDDAVDAVAGLDGEGTMAVYLVAVGRRA